MVLQFSELFSEFSTIFAFLMRIRTQEISHIADSRGLGSTSLKMLDLNLLYFETIIFLNIWIGFSMYE